MKKISLFLILLLCAGLYAQEEKSSSNNITAQNAIGVTIGGNFIVTGSFPSYLNERVDQFVTRIYNQAAQTRLTRSTDPEMQLMVQKELENYSFRNIRLKRINGEDITIDLLKFRRTGDYSQNPYLRHDDVLIFPPTDIERNFFTISGAVMNPGKYHYAEGDMLSDAIELSQGINKAYENISIRIYRSNYNGTSSEVIEAGVEDRLQIQRGDRIVVMADEPQKKDYNVYVVGEVNRPGAVPVSKSGTTIKDAIERAGGIKETSWLKNARLYTGNTATYILEKIYGIETDSKERYNEIQARLTTEIVDLEKMMMYRLSNLTQEDTGYFSIENHLRVLTEGTSFDLSGLEDDNTAAAAASYIVKDGDIIVIPVKQSTVYLFGSVVKPGHIPFEAGKDAGYYLSMAGGLGEHSEEDEIMLIKGTSRMWIPLEENPVIEEGDYIYVPRDEPRTFNYHAEIFARYLGILGSAATIILLLVQFGK
jgi:protein involved in polysaccharide export with SLBB domain